jgi:hypothetical protein
MKTIYKYRLEPQDETVLTLRGDVLSAGVQGHDIMVWAVHDDDAPERQVRVNVMGTGHDFVDAPQSSFVGTVFLGPMVFHIFATAVQAEHIGLYRFPPVDPVSGRVSAEDDAILMGQMRHCDVPARHRRAGCTDIMHDHGWIDTGTDLGVVVCPDGTRFTPPETCEEARPRVEPQKCSLCRRERTVRDAYDYNPLQAITGQPLGWYSGDDGEVCPECMTKTLSRQ